MELRNKEAKIIILSGKARSGKDTSMEIMKSIYESEGKKVINLAYALYIKNYAKQISNWDGNDETKPRELLQTLGTEIIRNKIDEEFFIKRMIGDIKVYSYFYDVIIISDARVKKEIDLIKNEFINVTSINIVRDNYVSELKESEKIHFTEVDLDDFDKFDYIINNNGSIEELEMNIREVMRSENL